MSQEFIDAATQGDVAKVKEMLALDPSLAESVLSIRVHPRP